MDLDIALGEALCFVYIGQKTGYRGVLRSDLERYEKNNLQQSGIIERLAEAGLVSEDDSERSKIIKEYTGSEQIQRIEAAIRGRTYKPRESYSQSYYVKEALAKQYSDEARREFDKEPDFLKTTVIGDERAKNLIFEKLKTVIFAVLFSTIAEKALLFLIINDLIKPGGRSPVDTKNPPRDYGGAKLDMEKGTFDCLFAISNSRLNKKLTDARKKFFDILVKEGLCIATSAYYVSEEKKPKRKVINTEYSQFYCVPSEVIKYLSDLFVNHIASFGFTEELLQKHAQYHSLSDTVSWPYYLLYDDNCCWGTKTYSDKEVNLFKDREVGRFFNSILGKKLLVLSEETIESNGRTWRKILSDYDTNKPLLPERLTNFEVFFLAPLIDNLFSESGTNGTIDFPSLEKIDVIIDASNVAHDNVPAGGNPRYDNIAKARQYYEQKNLIVRIIADASLFYYIDNTELYDRDIDRKNIIQSPKGRTADEYILKLALSHPNSIIVSNDDYKDWYQKYALAGEWRFINEVFSKKQRFVRFKINGDFIEFRSG